MNIVSSQMTGYSRRDTYRRTSYTDEVCKQCYRRLKLNSIIVPIVFWVLVITIAICLSAYLLPFIVLVPVFIDSEICYSIIGFILRPILGYYKLHPFGQELTCVENKELNKEIHLIKKVEGFAKQLTKLYTINDMDAYSLAFLPEIYEKIDNKKRFWLSSARFAKQIITDKESLQNYLSLIPQVDEEELLSVKIEFVKKHLMKLHNMNDGEADLVVALSGLSDVLEKKKCLTVSSKELAKMVYPTKKK